MGPGSGRTTGARVVRKFAPKWARRALAFGRKLAPAPMLAGQPSLKGPGRHGPVRDPASTRKSAPVAPIFQARARSSRFGANFRPCYVGGGKTKTHASLDRPERARQRENSLPRLGHRGRPPRLFDPKVPHRVEGAGGMQRARASQQRVRALRHFGVDGVVSQRRLEEWRNGWEMSARQIRPGLDHLRSELNRLRAGVCKTRPDFGHI